MDREEQIIYCEQCLHKGFDSNKGMICGLNGLVPELKDSCPEISTDPQIIKLKNWKKENKIDPYRDLPVKKLFIELGFFLAMLLIMFLIIDTINEGTIAISLGLLLMRIIGKYNSAKKKDE